MRLSREPAPSTTCFPPVRFCLGRHLCIVLLDLLYCRVAIVLHHSLFFEVFYLPRANPMSAFPDASCIQKIHNSPNSLHSLVHNPQLPWDTSASTPYHVCSRPRYHACLSTQKKYPGSHNTALENFGLGQHSHHLPTLHAL